MTIEECQVVCPAKKSPCLEEILVGPCRGSIKRFYFNQDTQQCQAFFWGGCRPNGNNFETIEECENICPIANKSPCYDSVVSGPCEAATSRFYYDDAANQCKLFVWGGCAATGNNFLTVEECENSCSAGRDSCLEPMESGPCFAAFERYYFEPSLRSCQPFTWGGCQENGNNFETAEACESSCHVQFWKQ